MVVHRSIVFRCNQTNCGKEFRTKVHLVRHCQQSHSSISQSDSPRPIMTKTRAAFLVHASPAAKLARILFPDLIAPRHLAKNPFIQINVQHIKQEIQTKFPNREEQLSNLPKLKPINRGHVVDVTNKLFDKLNLPQHDKCPEWLIPLPKTNKLSRAEQINNNNLKQTLTTTTLNSTRKRTHEQSELDNHNTQSLNRRALVAPVMNKQTKNEQLALKTKNSELNGKGSCISIVKNDNSDKTKLISSWKDTPNDLLFVSTDETKKLRKQIETSLVKRLRRSPCKNVTVDLPLNYDASKL